MPGRETVLANNQIYHIVNRGIAHQPLFLTKRDYRRAIDALFYYQNSNPPIRYSKFLTLSRSRREELLKLSQRRQNFLGEIICYCLMPNHFHFLVRQLKNNGISTLISNFSNSYTKYFNTKNRRRGPILEGKFKAIRIETDEQLLHVSRYIHLNPYTGYVVKNLNELENYPYSSFSEYLGKTQLELCSKNIILTQFKNPFLYKKFVFDNANYQRELDKIKHLLLE
ncbi:transposase [Candidatus Microgenomates bacterium]|nr:transposase [Candidatus Microgenomates bacterium]